MTLSEYRQAARMTQEELAGRVGTTAQVIRDLEEGESAIGDMRLEDALTLAKALGITAEQLAESGYVYEMIGMTEEDIEALKKKVRGPFYAIKRNPLEIRAFLLMSSAGYQPFSSMLLMYRRL